MVDGIGYVSMSIVLSLVVSWMYELILILNDIGLLYIDVSSTYGGGIYLLCTL